MATVGWACEEMDDDCWLDEEVATRSLKVENILLGMIEA